MQQPLNLSKCVSFAYGDCTLDEGQKAVANFKLLKSLKISHWQQSRCLALQELAQAQREFLPTDLDGMRLFETALQGARTAVS